MNALVILLISVVCLVLGYAFYGKWLAKVWGIDPSRPTPAHTMADGLDYCPAKAPVLLGHHFSSIAGAGPINGPILAAIFGWVPVLLWIILGGIFFGAVQDFSALFASIRHKGRSIGYVIEENIGERGKKLFLIFAWLTLLLVVAAFTSIVVGTFNGYNAQGAKVPANGTTATISCLFILMAILFGFFVYRRKAPLGISSVIGVICIVISLVVGIKFPIYASGNFWLVIVLAYIFIASVTPVWILLQPRDYLSSFLLYGMMIAAFIGVFVSHPTVALPAFTGFNGIKGNSPLFPMLFITVACGAISGFHSLVSSGTTAKQIDNEKDARVIGYGSMLIECALATIAIICAGILFKDGAVSALPPTAVFATGIATMIQSFAGEASYTVAYALIILSVSVFCLTSLDTATRLARYMFTEFFLKSGEDVKSLTGWKKVITNPFFSTFITVAIGGYLAIGGYAKVWPLFGAANQLLGSLALLAVAVWLGNIGKNNKMFYFPMVFMYVATITAMIITLINNFKLVAVGKATFATQGLQIIFAGLLVILAIFLLIEGVRVLGKKKPAQA